MAASTYQFIAPGGVKHLLITGDTYGYALPLSAIEYLRVNFDDLKINMILKNTRTESFYVADPTAFVTAFVAALG